MVQRITSKNFRLEKIDPEYHRDFRIGVKGAVSLSAMEAWLLRTIGDAFRVSDTKNPYIWDNGRYCWYVDDKQTWRQAVSLTTNGRVLYEDDKTREMWVVTDK